KEEYHTLISFFSSRTSRLNGKFEKRGALIPSLCKIPLHSCPQTHNDIRQRKEQIVLEQVLLESAMPCLARMERPLHDKKRMFRLAANRGFPVLDLPVPIRSFVFFHHVVLRGSFDNAVVHV
ncbi:MAG: hypothetical protein ACFN4Y_10520, partial [Centipeda sp. (in: firmicutes)]